ncbi:MAG: hypothetical protein ACXVZ1_05530 [Gaiellaceae bacterium]
MKYDGGVRSRLLSLLVALALAALLTSALGSAGATPSGAPAALQGLPFKAVLRAPTHHPVVNKPWPISITVTDLKGKPIPASLHMQVLFGGMVVGQVDATPPNSGPGKVYKFVGTWREKKGHEITWPIASVGQRIVFQAVVTAKGATKKLDWWIQVVKK